MIHPQKISFALTAAALLAIAPPLLAQPQTSNPPPHPNSQQRDEVKQLQNEPNRLKIQEPPQVTRGAFESTLSVYPRFLLLPSDPLSLPIPSEFIRLEFFGVSPSGPLRREPDRRAAEKVLEKLK